MFFALTRGREDWPAVGNATCKTQPRILYCNTKQRGSLECLVILPF